MDMKGEQQIPASRTDVWEALNDPEVLKACIPGCQELNKTGDNGFEATVQAKVGPVKAKFSGAVTLSDIDPPNGYTISGEGKGGAAGFAKGGAKVNLADSEGGTLLTYEVNANVGGKLAQIGSRLIDSTAKKMANDFFSAFSEQVSSRSSATDAEGGAEAAPQTEEATAEAPPAAATAAEPAAAPAAASVSDGAAKAAIDAADQVSEQRKGMSPWVWAAAIVIVAGLLIVGFGGNS